MSGSWLPKAEPPHKCDLPNLTGFPRPNSGDRWKCDCGRVYVVESVHQHGESWLQFRAMPSGGPT